jgi:hypothetical protein
LPALAHHTGTYSEDDVEGGIKINKINFFPENGNFLGLRSEKR